MSYNGWSNHATWVLKVHLDNTEGDQLHWSERTEYHAAHSDTPTIDLAEDLKQTIEEIYDTVLDQEIPANEAAVMMIRDVGKPDDVDFYEIAASFIGDLEE